MEVIVMMRDLIVFGEDWGGLPSSTQHLIRELTPIQKTVWVNSIGLRRPRFNWHDFKRIIKKLAVKSNDIKTKLLTTRADFHIINPYTIPAPKLQFERKIASKMISFQVNSLLKKLSVKHPVLWTSLPTAVDATDYIEHHALVYYCGDDFSHLAGVDHETVFEHEQKLVSKADLIITASPKLAERFPSHKTRVLTHGVDYQLFTRPTEKATDLFSDGRPIAGFYGSISEWLDLDLIKNTAERMPDWHFVFIGKAVIDVSKLDALDNIHFLGERSHESLPSYSQHWTASLLPFVNNPQIEFCNPLKLREYLATGRPVISTPLPALAPYKDYVHTVSNTEQLVFALKSVADEPFNFLQQCAVIDQTWSAKADELNNWLELL